MLSGKLGSDVQSRDDQSREPGIAVARAMIAGGGGASPTDPRPEARSGPSRPARATGSDTHPGALDPTEAERETLAEAGSDLLGERALSTLRGPMSRGAVPLVALASRLGWARTTLGRAVVRLVGREDAVPFDLAAAATFDLEQSGLAELWEAGIRTFRRQAATLGPEAVAAAAERPEVLRYAVTAMLADSFRREATGRYRRAFLNATLLEAAALSVDAARAERRGPGSPDPVSRSAGSGFAGPVDPVAASAAVIVDDWRRVEAAADSVYREALRFLLRVARRRVRPPWREADLITGLRALFDGYFLRSLRDPEDYPLERLAEMLWEVALALSEPGFLDASASSRAPGAVELIELVLAEAKLTGRLPTIEDLTGSSGRRSGASLGAPGPAGVPPDGPRAGRERPRAGPDWPGEEPGAAPVSAGGRGAAATLVGSTRPPGREGAPERATGGGPEPFADSAALWNACLEYLLAGRRELRVLAVAVHASAPAALEELLRAVATVVDEHAALAAATESAPVWGELERILAEMLASVVVPSAALDLDEVARVMLDAARRGCRGEAGWRAVLAVLPMGRPADDVRPAGEPPESRSSEPIEG